MTIVGGSGEEIGDYAMRFEVWFSPVASTDASLTATSADSGLNTSDLDISVDQLATGDTVTSLWISCRQKPVPIGSREIRGNRHL